MRNEIQEPLVHQIFYELAVHAKSPGNIYVTGGISAVLIGWRSSTIDIDLKLMPEPQGIFEAIRSIKERLQVNIELASPDNFIPELPNWQERSLYIATINQVNFFHYDFYSQALAKIERGHERDLADVDAMIRLGLVSKKELYRLFGIIEPLLIRYPAIEPRAFKEKVEATLG